MRRPALSNLFALVALIAASLTPRLGFAGCLYKANANVPYVAWTPLPVTYRISDTLTDAGILAAIDAAFQTWSSVPCSTLKFVKGQPFKMCTSKPCAQDTVDFDHGTPYLYVFWFTTASDRFTDPKDPKVKYASTSFFWQNNVGGIVGASIAVNAKDYSFSPDGSTGCTGTTFDTHDFMMPQIGGVSGLTDSTVAGSVMEPGLKFCSTAKRKLSADDELGLVYLYAQGATCKKPALDGNGCYAAGTTPSGDGGTTPGKDGGTTPTGDGGVTPKGDGGGTGLEGGTGGDGGSGVPPGEESGCCRVSHGGADLPAGLPLLLLFGLILLAALRRRA